MNRRNLVFLAIPLWLVCLSVGQTESNGQAQSESEKAKLDQAPQPLTNAAIVKLVKAGLGEDVILAMVKSQPAKYSVGTDDIIALKKASVPDKVISAMINRTNSVAESDSGTGPPLIGPSGATAKQASASLAGAAETGPELKTVKDKLIEIGSFYGVTGTIHNPNERAAKNIVVTYRIWKKWMGMDGHGLAIKQTGGAVRTSIKYLPPKQPVDFTATSMNAPIMAPENRLFPDPIQAEITAEWEK